MWSNSTTSGATTCSTVTSISSIGEALKRVPSTSEAKSRAFFSRVTTLMEMSPVFFSLAPSWLWDHAISYFPSRSVTHSPNSCSLRMSLS